MAGYSGTPLVKKLGIKAGHRVVLVSAPPGFAETLDPLPEDVRLGTSLRSSALFDVIVFFASDQQQLRARLGDLVERLATAGGLWIGWPKKASGRATDLSDEVVRAAGLATGLVDNKVCALDEVWSGLRFVFRLQDRPRRGARNQP